MCSTEQRKIEDSNQTVSTAVQAHRRTQKDLEADIPVWAPQLGAQKSFLVQNILSSIHSGN